MAHFYGVLEGSSRTQATRCGTKNSGVHTVAAGWKGSVHTAIWHSESDDQDHYCVTLQPWQGSGGRSVVLAEGILDANVAVAA